MNRIPSTVPNAGSGLDTNANNFDAPYAVVPMSAAGAIGVMQGGVPITGASALALTLAAPTAGLPSVGGNDGMILVIFDTTGHAHTVTTPASGVAPSHHILTFGGTVGQFVMLYAFNGTWYIIGSSGVTPS